MTSCRVFGDPGSLAEQRSVSSPRAAV